MLYDSNYEKYNQTFLTFANRDAVTNKVRIVLQKKRREIALPAPVQLLRTVGTFKSPCVGSR